MPWSEALYPWLIHSAIESLLVLAVGSSAVLLCRRPARRVWIIELTLAGCLVAPWLGTIPGYPRLGFGWRAATSLDQQEDQQEAVLPAPMDRAQSVVAPSVVPPSDDLPVLPYIGTPDPAPGTADAPRHAFDIASWIVGVYAIGVTLGLGWWLVGLLGLVKILGTTRPASPRCRELLTQIAGQRASRVKLLVSSRVRQPFAFAFARPVIVLPEDLCGDDRALRWSLAHEWAHIERHDFRAWLTAGLARMLFFYDPLVWWLRRELRLCQDFLADDRAACQTAQPEDYAEFLTAWAATGRLRPVLAGLGMGFSKSELYRRVVMLVQNRSLESRPPRLWTVLVTCTAVVLVAAAAALTASPQVAAEGATGSTGAAPSGDAPMSGTSSPDASKAVGTTTNKPAKAAEKASAPFSRTTTRSGETVIGARPQGNCSISGKVLSEATGKPVEGARMYLHYNVTHGSIFVNTDSEGTFEIKDLPTGPFSLCSSHTAGYQDAAYSPEGKPGRFPPFSLNDGEHRTGIVLRIKEAYRVSGKIVDENGKVPESQRWNVLAWIENEGGGEYHTQHASVNHADGSYVIDGLSNQPVYVMAIDWRAAQEGNAWPAIYYPSSFSRTDAKQVVFDESRHVDGVDITLRKEGGIVIEGTVRDEAGEPVPEAFVVVHRRDMLFDFNTAYTDARGHYQIQGLGAGSLLVHVDAAHHGFVRTRMPIDLDQASDKAERDFTLHRGVLISGKFVDEKGQDWQIGESYAYAAQVSEDRPARGQFTLNEGNFSLTNFQNKHRPENAADHFPGTFLRGEGDYDCDQAVFPTRSTFLIQGMMPGHTMIGLSPKKENQKVVKILYDGRDILESGIDTKAGDEIKDVTIVVGTD